MIDTYFDKEDNGAKILEKIWREELATNSLPFIPYFNEFTNSINGLLTGILIGNKSLYSPFYNFWPPFFDSLRIYNPFYNTQKMHDFLNKHFNQNYRKNNNPILAIRSLELESGTVKVFDNINYKITADIICSSAAIPILFSPKIIQKKHYLDGEMCTHSLIYEALDILKKSCIKKNRRLFSYNSKPFFYANRRSARKYFTHELPFN